MSPDPHRDRRLRLLVAAAAAVLASAAAEAPRIAAVRYWSLGDITRVAIETDEEAEYRSERVENPDRLVIDLPGVRRQAGTRGLQAIAVGDRLLKQIRVALFDPETPRVVLDLEPGADYSISQLTNPNRIIIELRAAGQVPAAPPARSVTGSHSLAEPAAVVQPVAAPPPAASLPPPRPAPLPAAPAPETPAAKPPSEVALAARRDSHGDRSLIRTLGLKLERVVIDAGHGGHDTGTIGPGGLMEKDLVLDVSKRLGALIAKRLSSEVIFTRADDTFVPLEERTRLANDKKADLFLSIHANSSRISRIAGSETFYLNLTTSEDALEVAARENATSQMPIHELHDLIQKITLANKVQESREFAGYIQKALYSGVPRNRGFRNRGVKKAPFVVLVGAQMPSVLAEVAFLSNPRDEGLLKRSEYRQRVAEALFKGVSQYASALSHFEVARQRSEP
jgi:N-acetylmuramoyl-L-alanine amidase